MRVPRVFHQIWLGGRMPAQFLTAATTWRDHHPGWQLKLWTEATLRTRYPELIAACLHPRHAANLYRYELLLEHGGIYIDTDFVCRRSIEPLIEQHDLFAAYQLDDPDHPNAVNNAFFGCTPGHPALQALVERVPLVFRPADELNCGPAFFTSVMREFGAHLFPRRLFYPFASDELERADQTFSDAYAVHYWSSKWLPFSDKRRIKPWS